MRPLVFAKGASGQPTTTLVADLSNRAPQTRYTHAAVWGCLSASVEWAGTLEEGFIAADQWLGNPIEIWSPDGEWCWEGLIWEVTFGAGNRSRTRSLEGYANYISVDWTQDYIPGYTPLPLTHTDVDLWSTYGIVEWRYNAGNTYYESAESIAEHQFNLRSRLPYLPGSGNGDARVRLDCVGWYRTLGYRAYTSSSVGTASIDTVLKTVLTAKAYHLSSDHTQIEAAPLNATTYYDLNETVLEIVKRLIDELPGYVFGVGRGRVPYLRPSQRFDTTASYIERTDGRFATPEGTDIAPWSIQADRIVRQVDFAPAFVATEAIEAVENVYIAEVTIASDGTVEYSATIIGDEGEVRPY